MTKIKIAEINKPSIVAKIIVDVKAIINADDMENFWKSIK